MPYNKAVRFIYNSTNIDFMGDEVDTVSIITRRKTDLQRLQNRKLIVYFLGDKWRVISLDLIPASADTLSNIETLRAISTNMTLMCYYADGTTIAEVFTVKIDPKVPSYFYGGYREKKMVRMFFYEVYTEGVTMGRPIGV